MSNFVDFYQGSLSKLALPAMRPLVYVNGVLQQCLDVIEIVRKAEAGHAKLRYIPAGNGSEHVLVEDIEQIAPMGVNVNIKRLYNGGIGKGTPMAIDLFSGRIDRIETSVDSDKQVVDIIARDFSVVLDRATVYGQRISTGMGESMFFAGLETVFNEDGVGNMAIEPVCRDGKSSHVFIADVRYGITWGCAEAIDYLLCEHLIAGQLARPSLEQLKSLIGDVGLGELDVNGLSLLKAIEKICIEAQVEFKFVPNMGDGGGMETIVFFKPGRGRTVELNHQRQGQSLNISKTAIKSFESDRNCWPITRRFCGQGDFKVYEATFELVKGWDDSLEGLTIDDYDVDSVGFEDVRDVWRKWCLNEAGDHGGSAFDLSGVFGTSEYACKPRVFEDCISLDSFGQSYGKYLEISYDNGLTWQEYGNGFDVLEDQCGVWLDSNSLDIDLWNAAVGGTLKIRITASLQSDDRVEYSIADGPINSVVPVVETIISKLEFNYSEVTRQSIFYGSDAGSNEVDDTTLLAEFVKERLDRENLIIEQIDVKTMTIACDYQVGDRVVCGPDSRDILGVRADNRSVFWIDKVKLDFQNQCSSLKVLRKRGDNER